MTVEELLVLLHDLPVDALHKAIYVENGSETTLGIEPITESCDNPTIVGYVIVEVTPVDERQRKFEFN